MQLPSLHTLIATHGLATRKSLGQHFLLDTELLAKIASSAGDMHSHHVIEIGPGPGGLTRALLAAGARSVTAIEKDPRCVRALKGLEDAYPERLTVREADALNCELTQYAPPPRAIVANLPYNIGTELLLRWLEQIYADPGVFASLTLMFQKEVAQRLYAAPGSKQYGRLSVFTQWLCVAEPLFDIPPTAFSPPPQVVSSLVRLSPRKTPLFSAPRDLLETALRLAFGQRRKMLRASLKSWRHDAQTRLEAVGIDPQHRPEDIPVADWARIVQAMA